MVMQTGQPSNPVLNSAYNPASAPPADEQTPQTTSNGNGSGNDRQYANPWARRHNMGASMARMRILNDNGVPVLADAFDEDTDGDGEQFPGTNIPNALVAIRELAWVSEFFSRETTGKEQRMLQEVLGTAALCVSAQYNRLGNRAYLNPNQVDSSNFDPESFHQFEGSYDVTDENGVVTKVRKELGIRRNREDGAIEAYIDYHPMVGRYNRTEEARIATRKLLLESGIAVSSSEVQAAFTINIHLKGMEGSKPALRIFRRKASEEAIEFLRGLNQAPTDEPGETVTGEGSGEADPDTEE